MFELYEFFINNKNKPLEYIILAAFLFIGDRLGRTFINSQIRRLFHINGESDFKTYVRNQQEIKQMLIAILKKEGITWHAHTFTQDSLNIAKKRKRPLLPLSTALSRVQGVKKFISWRLKQMGKINRGILLPLLSAIALFVKQVWGIEFSAEHIDMVANIILYLVMFAGLFIHPRKEVNDAKSKSSTEYFE